MNIQVERYQSWDVVVLDGEFTVASLYPARSELDKLEQQDKPCVALNLKLVGRLDSSAIGLLSGFAQRVRAKGGDLAVFGARGDILDILHLVNFEDRARVYRTRDDFERAAEN